MKGKLTTAGIGLALLAQGAAAAPDSNVYYINAPVVEAQPIVTTRVERVPQESCRALPQRSRQVEVHRGYRSDYRHDVDRYDDRRGDGDGVSTLIGGLIGGAIGRQFGDGRGRDAMTVVGAIAGASIASGAARASEDNRRRNVRYDDRADYRYGDRRGRGAGRGAVRCVVTETVRTVDVVDGWEVTYLHAGEEYTRRVEDRPGSHIRLRVEIEPLARSVANGRTI